MTAHGAHLTRQTGQPDDFDPMWWADEGACHGEHDLFFTGAQHEKAKAICAGCPVRVECLTFARRTGQVYGIWGGVSMGRG